MEDYKKKLKNLSKNKLFFIDLNERIMTVFDDFFYSRNDYDHLSPKKRIFLIEELESIGFTLESGSVLRYKSKKAYISKAIGLGVSPLDQLRKDLTQFDLVITTPLALFLYYLSINSEVSTITKLLEKCPINLSQAKDFSLKEPFEKKLNSVLPDLIKFQNEVIKKVK